MSVFIVYCFKVWWIRYFMLSFGIGLIPAWLHLKVVAKLLGRPIFNLLYCTMENFLKQRSVHEEICIPIPVSQTKNLSPWDEIKESIEYWDKSLEITDPIFRLFRIAKQRVGDRVIVVQIL